MWPQISLVYLSYLFVHTSLFSYLWCTICTIIYDYPAGEELGRFTVFVFKYDKKKLINKNKNKS